MTSIAIIVPGQVDANFGITVSTDKYTYDVGEDVEITLDGSYTVSSITDLNYISFMIYDSEGEYVWEQPTFSYYGLTAIGFWNGPVTYFWNQTYRLYESHFGDLRVRPPDIPNLTSHSWDQVPGGKYYIYASLNGNTISASAEIEIIQNIIDAKIDIDPDTLNLKSNGKWITAYIDLPEGYNVSEIDISTVILEGSIPAEWGDLQDTTLMVKFDRRDVEDLIGGPSDDVVLTITGELGGGIEFEGSDTIRVIDPT
jgi:hypothetical protein